MQVELAATAASASDAPGLSSRVAGALRNLVPLCALAGSRGSAILAQFASQLVVGALAGASGLGVLQLFTSWTCLAGEIIALGLPARAMRQVAVAYAGQQCEDIEDLLQASRKKILRAWFLLVVIATPACILMLRTEVKGDWAQYQWLMIATGFTAPLFALLRLYAESLKATGRTLFAISCENLTSPLAMLLMCALCWMTAQPVVTVALAITFGLGVAITVLALRVAINQQIEQMPALVLTKPGREENPVPAHDDLFFLWGSSVLSITFLNLPFLVMPLYVDTAQIGVFGIAYKLINVITTLLLLLAAVYGPAFARCAANQDRHGLKVILRRTQLICSAVFIPTAIFLVALGRPLGALFGEEFGELHTFLLILVGGQLFNALTGLSGVLLNMAGAASRELATLLLALAVAAAGSIWVGPDYGATGLALVFSGSIALKNIASYVMARKLLYTAG